MASTYYGIWYLYNTKYGFKENENREDTKTIEYILRLMHVYMLKHVTNNILAIWVNQPPFRIDFRMR